VKRKVVLTDKDGYVWLFTNRPDIEAMSGAIVNPDLSKVQGHPPEEWKLVDGSVMLMTDEELEARKRDIQPEAESANTHVVEVEKVINRVPRWAVMLMAGESLALAIELLGHVLWSLK
jgi:hypothetical protein